MIEATKKIIFVVVIVLGVVIAQTLYFYRGIYIAPPTEGYDVNNISIPSYAPKEFIDIHGKGNGTVLLDFSHDNDFDSEELNILISRIISRGYTFKYYRGSKNESENVSLKSFLKNASSFIVILPKKEFEEEEKTEIKNFVDEGGRLIMIADPTRNSEINTLSIEFGVVFWNDYLYNLKENDGNFRYIYLKNFKENTTITKNLSNIVFYIASSISSPGNGIVFTDNNTYSSSKEAQGKHSPVVLAYDGKVLAIGDLTFLIEPYNNVLDNNQLISNIADYITNTEAPLIDTVPPLVNNTSVNITSITLNDSICVNATVTDNVKVDKVWVRIINPNSIAKNTFLSEDAPCAGTPHDNIYGAIIKLNISGEWYVNTTFANDTSGNLGSEKPYPNIKIKVSE